MPPGPSAQKHQWIFGHGSIMFEPRFEYALRRHGVVQGWERRLGQPSVRNWGRPSHPAPTSCLVPGEAVTGIAFGIERHRWQSVFGKVMEREAQEPVECTVHIGGTARNALTWPMSAVWAEHPMEALVEAGKANVLAGGGPHGHALDYAGGLRRALKELGTQDPLVARYHDTLRSVLQPVSPARGANR